MVVEPAIMPEKIVPSVRLVGTDELLFRRIMSLLPDDIEVERYPSLDEVSISAKPPAFTPYQTQRVNETERQGIERYLQRAPRRLVVLCDQADPPELYRLAMTGAALGLIAVESDRSREHLVECLKSWYWGGLIRPDWGALGAPKDDPPHHVSRMMSIIELDPFRAWRVGEIADHLRISARTLNRASQVYFGCQAKPLLMRLRYQLIQRARATHWLSWEDLADLFEFRSGKEIQDWSRRYSKRRSLT